MRKVHFSSKRRLSRKLAKEMQDIENAHTLFFDGSYRKSHDEASRGIVSYNPQGKLVRKRVSS